jgi:methyl-accepting chemotaxis protein
MVAPLVCVLVTMAVAGVWIMEGTLADVEYINDTVMGTTDKVNDFVIAIRDTRRGLHELEVGHNGQAAQMSATLDRAVQLLREIHQSSIVQEPEIQAAAAPVDKRLPLFQKQIEELESLDVAITPERANAAMTAANELDADATKLGELVRDQAHMEHQQLYARFHWQVLAVAAISIIVINLLIVALLKMAAVILRPVDALVQAAQELGREHFETRVELKGADEFGQLARAYNQMAERLQAAEGRRVEVLGQVALALNHELNNIINIIELQLDLVKRRAGDGGGLEKNLQQIADSLARMTKVVASLRQARRIVLTDYVAGTKMLDLERSAQAADPAGETTPGAPGRQLQS